MNEGWAGLQPTNEENGLRLVPANETYWQEATAGITFLAFRLPNIQCSIWLEERLAGPADQVLHGDRRPNHGRVAVRVGAVRAAADETAGTVDLGVEMDPDGVSIELEEYREAHAGIVGLQGHQAPLTRAEAEYLAVVVNRDWPNSKRRAPRFN